MSIKSVKSIKIFPNPLCLASRILQSEWYNMIYIFCQSYTKLSCYDIFTFIYVFSIFQTFTDSSTGDFTYVHSNARAHRFNNGTIVLSDVEETDAGPYLCQASNGIASVLSKIIHLEVLGKCNISRKHNKF